MPKLIGQKWADPGLNLSFDLPRKFFVPDDFPWHQNLRSGTHMCGLIGLSGALIFRGFGFSKRVLDAGIAMKLA